MLMMNPEEEWEGKKVPMERKCGMSKTQRITK